MGIEIEYRDRSWEMWIEGTSDENPSEKDIEEVKAEAKEKGYELKNIQAHYDDMQYFWRLYADLVKIAPMNLYRIEYSAKQSKAGDYYDAAIFAAASEVDARKMSPCEHSKNFKEFNTGSSSRYEIHNIELLGEAAANIKKGIVLASFMGV